MSFPSPVRAPQHVLDLLTRLHQQSLQQEEVLNPKGRFISTNNIGDETDKQPAFARPDFDDLMRDKFIALDEDKCHFIYQLIGATGATSVVEAGTSYGVSTIYLALAVAQNNAALGKDGRVIATEKEPEKATKAKGHWKECGDTVMDVIDLRVGDLLETLKHDLPEIDLLLLDSKFIFLLRGAKKNVPRPILMFAYFSLDSPGSANSEDCSTKYATWCSPVGGQ